MKYLALVVIALVASVGQIALKASVLQIGSNLSTKDAAVSLATSFTLWLGVGLYATTSIAWLWALRQFPLAHAYPFLALTFGFVPVLSAVYLGESINTFTLIGISLIFLGVVVIGLRG